MSHSDLEVHFKDKAKKIPSSPVSLITANGPVDAETKHEVYNEALMNSPQFVELPSTPAVCSVGKKCMEQGFSFHWPTGEAPYFICPNGQKVQCPLRGNVPDLWRPRTAYLMPCSNILSDGLQQGCSHFGEQWSGFFGK